jgi:hypothetical protein
MCVKHLAITTLALVMIACGGKPPTPSADLVSREPVSVRGWIEDVEGSKRAATPEMESGRRTQIFQATSIWVENANYVSGGVAENGSFILLDVPPGDVTIGFNAPGAETAKLVLHNIPGSADVLVPALILKRGGASVWKPEAVKVRIAAQIDKPAPTGKTATVAGVTVPVVYVPLRAMVDRRDYPNPGGFAPLATYR